MKQLDQNAVFTLPDALIHVLEETSSQHHLYTTIKVQEVVDALKAKTDPITGKNIDDLLKSIMLKH